MRTLALFTVLLATAGTAQAGVFGGFSADETRYLRGADQICRPIPAGLRTAAPSCDKAEADEIAKAEFRKAKPLAGPRAPFRAVAKGNDLTIERVGSDQVIEWSALSAIGGVDGVYLSPSSKLIAVEYRTRMGGRLIEDVVVFHVVDPAAARATATASKTATKVPERSKAVSAAIADGQKQLRKRRWARALAAFDKALADSADDPEALYGAAVALARSRKLPAAVDRLKLLAASKHPEAVIWRVEARHDPAFKKLRADKEFRLAVGIDRGPKDRPSAYERLVGTSAHWEQQGIKCDRLRINLKLSRRPQTFKLILRDSCQGYTDTTRLSGAWSASGGEKVELTFPNPKGKDEVLACAIRSCTDSSGEDCLTCGAGSDLEMNLRMVRR